MIDRYYIQNKIVVFYIIVPKGISKGEYECFIDLTDFEKIKNLPLTVCHTPRDGDNYYISFVEYLGIEKYGKMNKKHLLHRWLLKVNDDERIDHKNYNGLDNRRKNLRITTFINNSTNRRGANKNNKSTGKRNVFIAGNFYRVRLCKNGHHINFPEKFINLEEAVNFAEKMRKKHYGEFAGQG